MEFWYEDFRIVTKNNEVFNLYRILWKEPDQEPIVSS